MISETVIEGILTSPYFPLFTFIFGVVLTIVLSYFFLFKSLDKKIVYEIQSYQLITEKISEKISNAPSLKIQYGTKDNSEDVRVLTSSIIKIENSGYNAIKNEDISPDDPLRIVVKEPFKIYFAGEIARKGTPNNFQITTQDEKYVSVIFHHLNRGDGIKVQVFHSGNSSKVIEILGTVIGGPKIKEKPEWQKNISKTLIVPIVSIIVSTAIVYFGSQLLIQNILSTKTGVMIFAILLFLLVVFLVYIASLVSVTKIHEYLMVKWLKKSDW